MMLKLSLIISARGCSVQSVICVVRFARCRVGFCVQGRCAFIWTSEAAIKTSCGTVVAAIRYGRINTSGWSWGSGVRVGGGGKILFWMCAIKYTTTRYRRVTRVFDGRSQWVTHTHTHGARSRRHVLYCSYRSKCSFQKPHGDTRNII